MIREFRKSDASAVRACIVELQDFERRIEPRLRSGRSMASAYLQQTLTRCRTWAGAILVAEHDGAIAGFVAVFTRVPFEELDDPPGEYALVADLVVRKRFRRRGYGRTLLREAERYAEARGAGELRIGVLSANSAAQRLYARAGFKPYSQILNRRMGHSSRR